jgi:hypothetical protein
VTTFDSPSAGTSTDGAESNADFESNLNRWQEAGWSIRDWRLAVYTNSDGDGYMKIIAVYSHEP